MSELRCRQCKKRPVWCYRNNDIDACKRCYHQVWNDTRKQFRVYHASLGLLEHGRIPASLAAYGTTVEEIAARLLQELEGTSWHTGAKHEVPLLITRCARLSRARMLEEEHHADLDKHL